MVGYLQLPDGREVDVANGLVLGRQSSCTVVVEDHKVSRRHAQLIVAGPVVEIEDLGSSNGTLLNNKTVKRRMLRDGDVVQIGTTRITYREGTVAQRPEPEVPKPEVPKPEVPKPEVPKPEVPQPEVPRPAVPQPEIDVDVLEFADDDVVHVPKVNKPVAKPDRPRPVTAATQIPAGGLARAIVIPKRGRGRIGMIGDDLRQMSVSMRVVGIVLSVAVACGLGYLAYRLVT